MPEPWPPRPTELAEWPIPWRMKWGILSNQLQDQGVPWPDYERQAFKTIKAQKEADTPSVAEVVEPQGKQSNFYGEFNRREDPERRAGGKAR